MNSYLGGLLLESVQNAVDQLLLQPRVNVRRPKVRQRLLQSLHDHLPVRLVLVLQVVHDPRDNLARADLVGNLDRRVDQLPIVAPVEGHALVPKVLEKRREDLVLDKLRLHAVGGATLLDHLEDNLLHFFVGRLELADEDDHDFTRVVVGVLGVHERDQVADGFQEGGQTL